MHPTLKKQLEYLALNGTTAPLEREWRAFLKLMDNALLASEREARRPLQAVEKTEAKILTSPQPSTHITSLHQIAHAFPEPIHFIDEDGVLLNVQPRLSTTATVQPLEKALMRKAQELLPGLNSARMQDRITSCLQKNEPSLFQETVHIDDRPHDVEVRLYPTTFKVSGKRIVVVLVRPVDQQTQLSEQERLMSVVFKAAHEGILIADKERKIINANNAATVISGYSHEQLLTMDPFALFDLDDEFAHEIRQELEFNQTWQGEITGIKTDGARLPLWLTLDVAPEAVGGIIHYIIMFSDISNLKHTEAELQFVARHDHLTNLPNRLYFQHNLRMAIERATRSNKKFALLYLDLDRFKTVNDTLGHHIGDKLLVKIGERMRDILRKQDQVARMGGDEFTVISENLERPEDAAVVAEKMLSIFNKSFDVESYKLDVGASIGISVFPDDSSNPDEIIKQADTAMYKAKEQPDSGYRFFTQEMTETAFHFLTTEQGLRRAIKNKSFFLLYQPQYSLGTGQMMGVEALVRWLDAEKGIMTPNDFLPVAEVTGLIEPIGRLIIERACQQAEKWKKNKVSPFRIGINLSHKQLNNPGFPDFIRSMLSTYDVPTEWIEFEITEATIFADDEVAMANLRTLADMGISFTLDDFGTGFSSLTSITSIPFKRLKIDRTFIRGVNGGGNDEAIIKTIIALGKNLGVEVIAEGVETQLQQDFLQDLGCEEVQGFLYSHPMTSSDIEFHML